MKSLTAVITSYNRADFLPICIRSVLASAAPDLDIRVLVMDNGSSDGSDRLAAEIDPRVRVEHTDDNRPVPSVLNRGLRIALEEMRADLVLLLNDDTEFCPGALKLLIAASDEHPNAVLFPMQLDYRRRNHGEELSLKQAGGILPLVEDAVFARDLKETYPVQAFVGAGMLARRELWERVGYFDELYRFYGPDDDYCNRAWHLGYEVLLVPRSHLLHAHGQYNAEVRHSGFDDFRKFRLLTQMRYMAILKNPSQPLPECYSKLVRMFLEDEFKYLLMMRPRGMVASVVEFFDCSKKLPRVAAARRDQFSDARRVPLSASASAKRS